jgi:hypothetical protein
MGKGVKDEFKPSQWKNLTVYPHDSILSMRVVSKSRKDIEHIVDLGAYQGNGDCTCEHFDFRLRPKIEGRTERGFRRCAHIEAARSALVDIVISKLANPHHYES